MSLVSSSGREITNEERDELFAQKELRSQIDELVVELGACNNHLFISRMEQKLKILTSKVNEDESQIYNLDSLLRKTKEERIKLNDAKSKINLSVWRR